MRQGLYLKQLQKLSPQQIQLMKLLQVPTAQLEDRIKEEIEQNPALEVSTDDELEQDEFSTPDLPEVETDEFGEAVETEEVKKEDDFDMSDFYDEADECV